MIHRVIQIDLGNYPVKLFFAIIVIILTIWSSYRGTTHLEELNRLPRNRSELTSVKSARLTSNGFSITADLEIEAIYSVTVTQHYKFLFLNLHGPGYNITLNNSNLAAEPTIGRLMTLVFDPPVVGNITASLFRSKSHLSSANFSIFGHPSLTGFSVISSVGETALGRQANFTHVCWSSDKLYYFSTATWVLDDPFITFRSSRSISSRKGGSSLEQFLERKSNCKILDGTALVIDLASFSPLDWNWIRNEAAPLLFLESNSDFHYILSLRLEREISIFGDTILPVGDDRVYCTPSAEVHHLHHSKEALAYLRQKLVSEKPIEDLIVVLQSSASQFSVSNLDEIAGRVCENCSKSTVVAENADYRSLIEIMGRARFVLAPHSNVISQAFWMKGTLIELIPEGTQCTNWTFEVSIYAGINHLRFAVGQQTTYGTMSENICLDDVSHLYNVTSEASADFIVNFLDHG
jgi:hypothetical protein